MVAKQAIRQILKMDFLQDGVRLKLKCPETNMELYNLLGIIQPFYCRKIDTHRTLTVVYGSGEWQNDTRSNSSLVFNMIDESQET